MAHVAEERKKQKDIKHEALIEDREHRSSSLTSSQDQLEVPSVTDGILDMINPATAQRRRGESQYKKPMGSSIPLTRSSIVTRNRQATSQKIMPKSLTKKS